MLSPHQGVQTGSTSLGNTSYTIGISKACPGHSCEPSGILGPPSSLSFVSLLCLTQNLGFIQSESEANEPLNREASDGQPWTMPPSCPAPCTEIQERIKWRERTRAVVIQMPSVWLGPSCRGNPCLCLKHAKAPYCPLPRPQGEVSLYSAERQGQELLGRSDICRSSLYSVNIK